MLWDIYIFCALFYCAFTLAMLYLDLRSQEARKQLEIAIGEAISETPELGLLSMPALRRLLTFGLLVVVLFRSLLWPYYVGRMVWRRFSTKSDQ
jgi:hypothetical protein